jgi:hypothetical protein
MKMLTFRLSGLNDLPLLYKLLKSIPVGGHVVPLRTSHDVMYKTKGDGGRRLLMNVYSWSRHGRRALKWQSDMV